MEEYNCKRCKYITPIKHHFERHLISELHLEKQRKYELKQKRKLQRQRYVENKIINAIQEVNNKIEKQNDIIESIQEVNKQNDIIESIQKVNDKIDKQNEKIEEVNNKVTDIKSGVKKITDCVDFLSEYCNDANVIEKLSADEISKMLKIEEYKKNSKTKFALQELLLYKMEGKQLPDHLCNIIVNHYSNNNPTKQGLWASDTARLTYIIMQLTDDNKKQWVRDKKGELFMELIANPIVMKIRDLFNEFVKYKTETYVDESDEEESTLDKMKKIQHAFELNSNITATNLNKNITKLTASKISLNKKKNEIVKK
jgi:hypothetical protein